MYSMGTLSLRQTILASSIYLMQSNKKDLPSYIGKTTTLRQQLLGIMYASALGGHSGQLGTLKRLQLRFYWPAMKKDVQHMVSTCDICQTCKDETVAPPGLLRPLVIPTQALNDISLDFIEGLPLSRGKNVILVVIDSQIWAFLLPPLLQTLIHREIFDQG